jgi:hypothetical protein
MSEDKTILTEKLDELFTQFKDIIAEIKSRNSEISDLRTENERIKTLYFASESRPPSEIRRPANAPILVDYTNSSIDGLGLLAEHGILKNSTKINREAVVLEAKQKAYLKKTMDSLTRQLKSETEALERMEGQLVKTTDKIQRSKESYELLSNFNKQLYPKVEKKRQIEERIKLFASENEKLARVLQVMMQPAQQKASRLTKAEHDELIKRFHKERKELMAKKMWDKTLGRVFSPSPAILEAQQQYLDALKESLNLN